MHREPTTVLHVTPEELAGFLDRRLAPATRTRLAEHLAECAACRSDLVRAGRVVRGSGLGRRLALGATAALAVLVATVSVVTVRRLEDTRVRGGNGAVQLIAYAPIGQVESILPRFTWGAASPGALYRLSLFDPKGATLWTTSIRDTSVTLPDASALTRDTTYTWIVDALQRDGSELSTGIRQFRIGQ